MCRQGLIIATEWRKQFFHLFRSHPLLFGDSGCFVDRVSLP
ncbi:hypothetical protein F0726_00001 [Acidithiobacillus caldus]|nr:hypothetical protein F0726_00001 [Acidithiobacillus caldus]